ncbi:hypothetical protein T03_11523 [Trichinella britovi]|uniref:Uncharacterized protein n=1 Tax=Trichinella britovi TaxID=45882 RepID=A0A0V1CDK6_TRIBR|nr:hypothetical protein T03_11523 [Trichinella britovi]
MKKIFTPVKLSENINGKIFVKKLALAQRSSAALASWWQPFAPVALPLIVTATSSSRMPLFRGLSTNHITHVYIDKAQSGNVQYLGKVAT